MFPFCLAALYLPAARAAEPDTGDIRAAIEKSLPYIQREGVNWIEKRKCVSCHQVPFMVWSLNAAAAHGFDVDSEQLKKWNEWAIDWNNFSAPKNGKQQDESETAKRNVDTIYQLMLANREYKLDDFSDLKLWTLVNRLKASQQKDGSWNACGQLPFQKRPKRETKEVTTMWALIALKASDSEDPTHELRQDFAAKWLTGGKEGQSTEWWAVKLMLGAGKTNGTSITGDRKKLTKFQHDDGGWGWLTQDNSDALATGIALYALSRSGLKHDDPTVTRAQQFLLNSQQKDGSWKVIGTKQKAAGRATKTATYWGTCWAVIGMLESLERNAPAAKTAD